MRTMDDAAAREIIRRHADEVLGFSGWAGYASGDSQPVPCRRPEGDDSGSVHYASGSFQLIVPIDQHRSVVDRVAWGWAQRGYTVDPVTAFPDGGAKATARTGDGFVDMTLGSGEAPAMVLVIVTDCYRLG